MPVNNTNIPQYTAADLLRYASGRMSAPEMHQLEKAALEDPFLAEALEGYVDAFEAESEPNLQKHIDRLPPVKVEKKELKVIPLWRRKALQIAIAAAVIVGGGWWIFSLLNQPQKANNQVAKSQGTPTSSVSDSVIYNVTPGLDSNIATQQVLADTAFQSPMLATVQPAEQAPKPGVLQQKELNGRVPGMEVTTQSAAPVNAEVAEYSKDNADAKTGISSMKVADSTTVLNQSLNDIAVVKPEAKRERALAKAKNDFPYAFYGKVTDAKNNPLPYANIMIADQEMGTYTDANGNFNFISRDSSLDVRTKSLGYMAQNLTLKPGINQNNIRLQEDTRMMNNLTVITPQRQQGNNTAKMLPLIVEKDSIEGVEPAIGKTDYSLYLANNNRISELPKLGKQVKLAFDIDKDGNATNIKINQSSGEALDAEAIRLLKEGPKWDTKKGKKGKITVKF